MKQQTVTVIGAFLFTAVILLLGYIAFGFWTALIFTSGFLGGYLLWIFVTGKPSFASLRVPFWVSFSLFIVHRVEEKIYGFFARLSDITGVQTPAISSWPVILLVLVSVGAWITIPVLVKKGYAFGYYLAWTFFAAMGITELAHFIFPFFTGQPYGYFPGMASVLLLAPVAWWGMYRLSRKNQ
ncbi:HXXEE domain-containing protein [Sediminibacterium roseum]|uniref:HXXEE domain-containing protein n=1 Tax=Sediminibacterium roseum TaxID=1978412 RepID=A0ABW9ZQ50_9BACT|nr:HXXEE domain-containing protein [Sediminibacterium roseum]NCI49217.1 HXXEE domain-containing protein [Sediminibacterium roseum]